MRKASGFTIIELVVVITIIGILAAVAMPKFFDMQTEARRAAVQGIGGALASGSAINYGAFLARGSVVGGSVQTIDECTKAKLQTLMHGDVLPAYITVDPSVAPAVILAAGLADGTIATCILGHSDDSTVSVDVNIIKVD